ncbi:hypothetical protein LCGC14_1307620 [marine sediment metagenome]|uniref:Uncharacterized protein n=1 Tax=marine sediment metagenome TaxID=412755 RepID=A0A0F9NQR2_9ZZZZ
MTDDSPEYTWWATHGPFAAKPKPFVVLLSDGESITVIERRSSRAAAETMVAVLGGGMWVEFDPEHLRSSGTTMA